MGRETAARDRISELQSDGFPTKKTSKLTPNSGSFTLRIMKRAVIESERNEDDPGEVDQYFFEDDGIVVIDLKNDE